LGREEPIDKERKSHSAAWCATEFGSALAVKPRTGQFNVDQAHAAWTWFERLVANDALLLPICTVVPRPDNYLELFVPNNLP
jgi:hypothetical protein